MTFEPRMANPASILPGAFKGIGSIMSAISKGGIPQATLELVALRASQINGCSPCVQGHLDELQAAGESVDRIVGVGAWSESPYFDEAERAALALADELTRLADRNDPVPDALWQEVRRHYDETQTSALILQISLLNLFNRINVTVKERADRPSWKQAA